MNDARRRDCGPISALASPAVEMFLVLSALGRSIVVPAPPIGALATMVLPAAKRAAEIPTASVARMSQEANPTVAACHRAVLQIRTIAQNGVQR